MVRLDPHLGRHGVEFEIPVDPSLTGLIDVAVPAGIVLVPADAVAEDPLRELDDRLRMDAPGCHGWRNDPQEFRDHTSTSATSTR